MVSSCSSAANCESWTQTEKMVTLRVGLFFLIVVNSASAAQNPELYDYVRNNGNLEDTRRALNILCLNQDMFRGRNPRNMTLALLLSFWSVRRQQNLMRDFNLRLHFGFAMVSGSSSFFRPTHFGVTARKTNAILQRGYKIPHKLMDRFFTWSACECGACRRRERKHEFVRCEKALYNCSARTIRKIHFRWPVSSKCAVIGCAGRGLLHWGDRSLCFFFFGFVRHLKLPCLN